MQMLPAILYRDPAPADTRLVPDRLAAPPLKRLVLKIK